MGNFNVSILNKTVMKNNLTNAINIDNETSNLLGLEKYGKGWNKNEFLHEVKDKWKYSLCALDEEDLVGYLISSNYNNKIHSHRLAMKINLSSIEKIKITKLLFRELEILAKLNKISCTSAIVPIANISTAKFYLKEGWSQLKENEIDDFIRERKMEAYSKSPNLLIDKFPSEFEPSKSFVFKYYYENN